MDQAGGNMRRAAPARPGRLRAAFGKDGPPRLLLLDFYFPDRYSQFRSRNFPFLLGQAHKLGIAARWLCCWLPPGQKSWERYQVRLTGQAADNLLRKIAEFSATHLVVAEKLVGALPRKLHRLVPDEHTINLADRPPGDIVSRPAEWLPQWLGLPVPAAWRKRQLLDAVDPRYECTGVNRIPGTSSPPVHISSGIDCAYRRPLASNPHFKNLSFDKNVRNFACSFCVGPADLRPAFRTRPLALALRQCQAASTFNDTCLDTSTFVVSGAAVFARLEKFFAGILALRLAPARFFFGCRIDELLRLEQVLERIMEKLDRAGHSFNLFNLGVENFSPVENERLNKGLSLDVLERGDRLIRRLEQRFPRTFQFSRWGGYGLILFTPWTTLRDLAINIEYYKKFKGIGENGFALSSKLQILEESAIHQLARHDGLVRKSFRGFPRYDSGCIFRHDQREVPWRFRHRQVEHLYRIASRLAPVIDFPANDELLERTRFLMEAARSRGWSALAVFERALRLVGTSKGFCPAPRILGLLEKELLAPEHTGPGPDRRGTSGRTSRLAVMLESILSRLARAGAFPGGVRLKSVEQLAGTTRQLVLSFESDFSALVLYLIERQANIPAFLSSGHYLLRYHEDTPPEHDWQRVIAASVLAHAEVYLPAPGKNNREVPAEVVPLPGDVIANMVGPCPPQGFEANETGEGSGGVEP